MNLVLHDLQAIYGSAIGDFEEILRTVIRDFHAAGLGSLSMDGMKKGVDKQ